LIFTVKLNFPSANLSRLNPYINAFKSVVNRKGNAMMLDLFDGENEDIANAIEVYMQHKFLDLKSLEKYHVAVMELIGELYHFMVNNEMDTTKIPGGIGSLYNELCNLEPQVLQKWLLKFCCTAS